MTEGSGVNYIETVLPDIKKAAQRVAKKWPQVTTEEDLFQDLTLHFLERPGSLEKLAHLTADKRLARLVAIGHEKASASRDDLEQFSGQFNYSVEEVRKLLLKGAILHSVSRHEAASADVQTSMVLLKKRNQDYWSVLVDRYVNGGATERALKDILSRATESLTTLMNRARASQTYEFTNGGRYRNNKAAVSQIREDYDGVELD